MVLQLVEGGHQVVLQSDQRFSLGQFFDEVLSLEADGEHVGDVVVEIAAKGVVTNQRVIQGDPGKRSQLQAVLLEEGFARHYDDVFPRLTRRTCGLDRLFGFRGFRPGDVRQIQIEPERWARVRWSCFVAASLVRRGCLWILGQRHFCDA